MISQTAQKVILVVDDDNDIRKFFATTLTGEGFKVHEATNGREALDCISRNPPNFFGLIFLDMQMPVMDGWKFLPLYRQFQQNLVNTPKAPVIVMTAAMTVERYSSQIKADDYLPKPFNLNDLIALLNKYFPEEP